MIVRTADVAGVGEAAGIVEMGTITTNDPRTATIVTLSHLPPAIAMMVDMEVSVGKAMTLTTEEMKTHVVGAVGVADVGVAGVGVVGVGVAMGADGVVVVVLPILHICIMAIVVAGCLQIKAIQLGSVSRQIRRISVDCKLGVNMCQWY